MNYTCAGGGHQEPKTELSRAVAQESHPIQEKVLLQGPAAEPPVTIWSMTNWSIDLTTHESTTLY